MKLAPQLRSCGLLLLGGAWLLSSMPTTAAVVTATAESEAVSAPVFVFAAASLADAVQASATAFSHSTGITVRTSFAATSTLARQIESGAPADVFIAADVEWMDYLQQRHLIDPASRHELLGNRLVLIAPAASPLKLTIAPRFDLIGALGAGRLATGDPDSVPAGRYARDALTTLGVWRMVEPRLVRADNVRAALAFVARGEVPLGVVYRTDALATEAVRVVDVFPEDSHPPIVYPIALCTTATRHARQFADYLRGPAADAIFVKYGFVPLHR